MHNRINKQPLQPIVRTNPYLNQELQFRKSKSANKSRFEPSPFIMQRGYQNKSSQHNPQLQSKLEVTHNYYQRSIDVNDTGPKQYQRQGHSRIKTEANDSSINLNNRIYPYQMKKLLEYVDKQTISLKYQPQLAYMHSRRTRVITQQQQRKESIELNSDHKYKQSSQPDLILLDRHGHSDKQPHRTLNKYSQIVQSAAHTVHHEQVINVSQFRQDDQQRQPKFTVSEDSSPFYIIPQTKKQQQQQQLDTSNQESSQDAIDVMQFSFGMQQNKKYLRELNQKYQDRRFPKDVFLGDVRKAKKILSQQ